MKAELLGRFNGPPMPKLRVSPLGLVPKKAQGEFRLIHHLSFPHGGSVNDFIPEVLCSVKYTSFDAAVRMVRECGPAALMGKCDVKSAFRLLPIHPGDVELLGFQFEGGFYVDRALPMGCSISCSLFERFSSFLEWAHKRATGSSAVVHYLDDFLMAGQAGTSQCLERMQAFQRLCASLGVPLAQEKTEGPATSITFLGIELDSVTQTCRLPIDKLAKLRFAIEVMLAARKVTLRQVQELAGLLNFACRVVAPGRAFIRRLYSATRGVSKPHHRLKLGAGVKADLQLWLGFLRDYNGVAFWRQERLLEAELQVKSDASGAIGFGVVLGDRWCSARWPEDWLGTEVCRDLTFLEFFPLVVAVELWGGDFTNHTVHFWCDNLAVVHVVNSLSSKNERVMRLVRFFVRKCLELNILFFARHVPGIENDLADALSRGQLARFRKMAPEARGTPEVMPPHLWSLGGSK